MSIGNFLSNAGTAMAAGQDRGFDLQKQRMAQVLQQLQLQKAMQDQKDAMAQRQAGGQAFNVLNGPQVPQNVAVPGAQPMPQGMPGHGTMPPMPGAQPQQMPQGQAPVPMGGRIQTPGNAPLRQGVAPQAPVQAPQPQPQAAPQPGGPSNLPAAFDVPQLVSRINQAPETKDLPSEQKWLILQQMQAQLNPEGKAQLELLKQQHQLEMLQARLDSQAERWKDHEQFMMTYEGVRQGNRRQLEGDRQGNRVDLEHERETGREKRLKTRMDATAADKEAKKPLEALKLDRQGMNDEIKGLKAELQELGTGMSQPQPGTPDYDKMLSLREQIRQADERLKEIDKTISSQARAPKPNTPQAPQTFTEGQVYTDADGNKATYQDGKFVPVQ